MWHSVASRDDAGKADGSGGPDPSGVDDDDEDDEEEDDDADEKKKTKGSLLLLLLLLLLLPLLRRALHLRAVVLKACIISISISGEGKNDTLSYLLAKWWGSLWASQCALVVVFYSWDPGSFLFGVGWGLG